MTASSWRVDPPHPAPGPHASAYALTFGKHKGRRLDQVPAEYLLWLADFAPSESLRKLARKALELDVVLDEGDPLQTGEASAELAAHVLPRLAFEFEQKVRAELGQFGPSSADAALVARLVGILRDLVTTYTGRCWPGEGVA